MATPPTTIDHLYVLICFIHLWLIFPATLYVPLKSILPHGKTLLKEGILDTAEYTAEAVTIILPNIVLFTLFTGGMLLDGMTLQRHNFPVPHQNATPRMGTATNCHHVTRIHVKPDA